MVDARGVPRFSVRVGTIPEHRETKKGRMVVRIHLVAHVIIVRVRLTSIMLVRVQPRPQHKKYNWASGEMVYATNFKFCFKRNTVCSEVFITQRDIVQLVERVLWEHEVVGSSPAIPTSGCAVCRAESHR